VADNPSSDVANLVVFELVKRASRKDNDGQDDNRTLDIFTDASNSSLMDMEKELVCCPIWMLSPRAGAYMSFVMARMFAQLSIKASVAWDDA
jgi:hypothetical protein